MKQIKGGITAPLGFQAAGIACGLKRSGKPDLALIYSEVPATAAGVFTTNQVKAAPVLVSQQQLKSPKVQAIIANAGNANCWTGQKGLDDAWEMVRFTAKALGLSSTSVLVASTGVIGQPLPIENKTEYLSTGWRLEQNWQQRGSPGYPDHRHKSQRNRGKNWPGDTGRHRQRLRHDRPRPGNYVRLYNYRCQDW